MKYKWIQGWEVDGICNQYEVLVRPDGTEVTVITEPEDRTGYRDLAAVADELNKLYNNQKENN